MAQCFTWHNNLNHLLYIASPYVLHLHVSLSSFRFRKYISLSLLRFQLLVRLSQKHSTPFVFIIKQPVSCIWDNIWTQSLTLLSITILSLWVLIDWNQHLCIRVECGRKTGSISFLIFYFVLGWLDVALITAELTRFNTPDLWLVI